jgi:hypothetical protein
MASFSGRINQWIRPEKIVSKNVNLIIVPENNFGSSAYAHSSAMINVTVIKLSDHKTDTIFVKDYPNFSLRSLPSYSRNFKQSIHIPNVADRRERIVFLYTVIYKSKGSLLKIPFVNYIGHGATNDDIHINI